MKKLNEFMTRNEAARHLGVNPATLLNWERAGKIKARKSPFSNRMMYIKEDLDKILHNLQQSILPEAE